MVDRILLWCDYFSMVPILVYFSGIYAGVYFNILPEALSFTFFSFLNDQSTKLLKSIPYPDFMWDITRRPEGAYNTDYFSRNGPASKDAPGFPSGHMTMASVFSVYRLLRLYRKQGSIMLVFKNNTMEALLYVAIIIAMAYARWYKRCHNIVQIIAGFILGSVFAFVLDKIVRDFL